MSFAHFLLYFFGEILYTVRVSNNLHPDQAQHFVWPDLGPNCLQRLSADNISKQRVKVGMALGQVNYIFRQYSKTFLNNHSQREQKLVYKTNLMQVKSIAECSKRSNMQYFRPSLSYHLSLRSLFCLFLSGHLRQVLLYI